MKVKKFKDFLVEKKEEPKQAPLKKEKKQKKVVAIPNWKNY